KIDKDTNKPAMIVDYNHTKYGVDVVDKMCVMYNVTRTTRRWPLTVFFDILNIGGINALNLYVTNGKLQKLARRNFLKCLSLELVRPCIIRRIYNKNVPRPIRQKARNMLGIQEAPNNQDENVREKQVAALYVPEKTTKRPQ
ncbi:hypothetical protein PPYR_05604, partial [Photinus pyralis]